MKTEFKAKFLQTILQKKKDDEGFTLIELLVVIIIIGILSAIALPSFLNQANKAKQSEAKTYVGSMNRAQQAYYLENNTFADQSNFGNLGLGIATSTQNYVYQIQPASSGSSSNSYSAVTNQGRLKNQAAPLKAYIGGVSVATQSATSEATTIAVLCEAKNAGVNGGPTGTETADFSTTGPSCPTNYVSLAK